MSQEPPLEIDAAARAEALSYKLRKEAFVSNLSGSSLADINTVTLVATSAILLWTSLSKRGVLAASDPAIGYVIDFLLNICAILFAFTAYSSAPTFLNLLLVAPAALLLLPLQQRQRAGSAKTKYEQQDVTRRQADKTAPGSDTSLQAGTIVTRPFLTNYRGALLIATCLAILAVDFPIFPRRFAKVETWGTSMMDLGVGNFVFSAGIVGARPVIREDQKAAASPKSTSNVNFVSRMTGAVRHSLPLLVLGFARLLSVKNLDYAEHVTEYGVHWNFFFTLALLPPFVEAVDCCLALIKSASSSTTSNPTRRSNSTPQPTPRKSIRYDLVAILIASTYELILNNTSLLSFILISPRTPTSSLLAKNREGIFSFSGYLAIFLAGRSTGILACQFHLAPPSTKRKDLTPIEVECSTIAAERRRVILPQLALRAAIYTVLYLLSTNVYVASLGVSRRLANLPYVLWTVAYNNFQLSLFAAVEAVGPSFAYTRSKNSPSSTDSKRSVQGSGDSSLHADEVASPIMRAFNKNGLAVFLLANLLTGLVNLSLNTLDMGNAGAMGVLILYAGTVALVAVLMDVYGVKIKI